MMQGGLQRILSCFTAKDTYGFVELCRKAAYTPDLGRYYIQQLTQQGYLVKSARGRYTITLKGRSELSGWYRQKPNGSKKPRVNVLLVMRQGSKFLVIERSRQPFIGTVEWPAGAVQGSEALDGASRRILAERTGLSSGEPLFAGFFRRVDMYDDTLFDDKLFAVYTYQLPKGVVLADRVYGHKLMLLSDQELQGLNNRSLALLDILAYTQGGSPQLLEKVYELKPYATISREN